jgi:hypothetical protein
MDWSIVRGGFGGGFLEEFLLIELTGERLDFGGGIAKRCRLIFWSEKSQKFLKEMFLRMVRQVLYTGLD